jgi:FkbM family methyltransferase
MQALCRLVDLYRSGGVREVSRGIRDFLRNNLPYYYAISNVRWPDRRTLAVGDVSISLDTSTPTLVKRFATVETERSLIADFVRELNASDVCWDVGSNVGIFACLAAARGADTVAFEPVPANTELIRRNAVHNDLSVRAFGTALGAESGTARIPNPDAGGAGANFSLLTTDGDATVPTLDVSVSTGDHFVTDEDVSPPTVLKIDVEGAEAAVLDGLSAVFTDHPPRVVYVEVHEAKLPEFGASAAGVRDRLRDAGYRITRLQSRDETNYHLKATRS